MNKNCQCPQCLEFEYDDWPRIYSAVQAQERLAAHRGDSQDSALWQNLKTKVSVIACRAFPEVDQDDAVSLVCPVCEQLTNVYHFRWEAITCGTCQNMVQRCRWKLHQDVENELPF